MTREAPPCAGLFPFERMGFMEGLEQKLSYRFRDRRLLDEALSHSSYVNEHRGSGIFSN